MIRFAFDSPLHHIDADTSPAIRARINAGLYIAAAVREMMAEIEKGRDLFRSDESFACLLPLVDDEFTKTVATRFLDRVRSKLTYHLLPAALLSGLRKLAEEDEQVLVSATSDGLFDVHYPLADIAAAAAVSDPDAPTNAACEAFIARHVPEVRPVLAPERADSVATRHMRWIVASNALALVMLHCVDRTSARVLASYLEGEEHEQAPPFE